jgi:hypothetical protein
LENDDDDEVGEKGLQVATTRKSLRRSRQPSDETRRLKCPFPYCVIPHTMPPHTFQKLEERRISECAKKK